MEFLWQRGKEGLTGSEAALQSEAHFRLALPKMECGADREVYGQVLPIGA